MRCGGADAACHVPLLGLGHGDPCGKALTSHKDVARISFTGGAESAKYVIQNSANNFAETSLELGGKSPLIVFEDANIESALNASIAAIFGASGQSCVAGSRLYLHEDIADNFLERIKQRAEKIVLGNPLDENTQMGPLCTTNQILKIETEISHAVSEGATILCGGQRLTGQSSLFFKPTIILCPNQKLRIVDIELFGPVLCVIKFKTEEEVARLANDTKFGLAAGVFTQNSAKSLRMAKILRAGIVWINTYRMVSPIAEFGGFKHSGFGRESGFQAMFDYTRPKTIWLNTSDEPISDPFIMR